jgi:molybdate transport system ATP-binding protein
MGASYVANSAGAWKADRMNHSQRHRSETAQEPLFFLENATAVRPGGETALRDLTWTVHEGETWSVVGPVASGKTSLANVLLGRCRIDHGVIGWPLLDRLRAAGRTVAWPSDVIRYVGFKEESWLFSRARHYYQQRFNFIEPHEDLTLETFLRAGTSASDDLLARVARQLRIDTLRPLSFLKLSNGEIRRARIAKALLSGPEWLILDEPFMGLDEAGRRGVATILGELIEQRTRVLLITRTDCIPEWVTHVLELDRLTVSWQGRRAAFLARLPHEAEEFVPAPARVLTSRSEPIIEMRCVNVRYGDRLILRDVSWTVRRGERWALLGPNGSGKTTLLSLICGDHPQAYSNEIRLFGRQRGTGESIWEIKRHIGLVSPELHLYFSEPLSAAQTAATGFFDAVSYRPTTPEQSRRVSGLLSNSESPRWQSVVSLAFRPENNGSCSSFGHWSRIRPFSFWTSPSRDWMNTLFEKRGIGSTIGSGRNRPSSSLAIIARKSRRRCIAFCSWTRAALSKNADVKESKGKLMFRHVRIAA